MSPLYVLAVSLSLRALAPILAVIRAEKKDLPAIIHGPGDNGLRDDDDANGDDPPSLPKP